MLPSPWLAASPKDLPANPSGYEWIAHIIWMELLIFNFMYHKELSTIETSAYSNVPLLQDKTPYTEKPVAPGATVGGSSWTKDWLKFDNRCGGCTPEAASTEPC